MVIGIVIAGCAIFLFGTFIGYVIGHADGEDEAARWYEGEARRRRAAR